MEWMNELDKTVIEETAARYALESECLVSIFYNLENPDHRQEYLNAFRARRGTLVWQMYDRIVNSFKPEFARRQRKYSPKQFDVVFFHTKCAARPTNAISVLYSCQSRKDRA